jgi:hypothetical protein
MHTEQARRAVAALLCLAPLVGAAGCGGESDPEATRTVTEPVTSGALDPGDPAVVRIEGGLAPCSGTLIATDVVLTAAHCVELPPTTVFFGSDAAAAGDRVGVIAHVAHPAFEAIRVENDVALLLLERPPSAATPAVWMGSAPTGSWVGAEVRLVGFGLAAPGAPAQGEKRAGMAHVDAAGDTDLHLTPSPSLPCLGDSGGPVLAGERVVGVVSSGDPGCSDHARAMRVDAYAGCFIAPQLAAWEAAGSHGGGCAVQGERSTHGWAAVVALAGCIVALARARRRAPAPRSATPRG